MAAGLAQDLLRAAWLVIGLGSAAALVLGLALLLDPARVARWGGSANRWVSTRQLAAPLNQPIHIERRFYRHHRAWGLFIIGGSLLSLGHCAWAWQHRPALTGLFAPLRPLLATLAVDVSLVLLASGALFTLIIGLLVYVRPSELKGLESWGNRWVSTRRLLRFLETPLALENRALAHPQWLGGAMILGGLYVLVHLWLARPWLAV
jgi:hypothetical protein